MHALAAFEAAARLGGFAPAAEELYVTGGGPVHLLRGGDPGPGAAGPRAPVRAFMDWLALTFA
jgi:LysR family glycine cleavage system transcriptional activator